MQLKNGLPLSYTRLLLGCTKQRMTSEDAIHIQKRWRGSLTRKDFMESGKCIRRFKKVQEERKKSLLKHKLALLWSMYPETLDVLGLSTWLFGSTKSINSTCLYETLLQAYTLCKLNNHDGDHIEKLAKILHETGKKVRISNAAARMLRN